MDREVDTETDIILTKLSVPALRANRVVRGRLIQKAAALPRRALLVLSAPAGYGKSMLMAEWAARSEGAIAWLSLGPAENDLVRFWNYVTASLMQAVPTVSRAGLRRIALMRRPPFETPLRPLIDEVAAHPDHVSLFLDDFHCILDPMVRASVATFVNLAPPNLRVFIAGRTSFGDLIGRLDGSVTVEEIRTRTVAFTRGESAEFFDLAIREPLSGAVRETLLSRTDGWAAGLQIAAFGLREAADPEQFARQFSGQHRHLLDFFREEVLAGIMPNLREFVVKTSILDRFNAELCDAVLQRSGSAAVLEDLGESDILIVPLDEEGNWYRYQSLFRDVARQHLESEYAADAPLLHERAADWLERNGLVEEAVAHAILAKNWQRVVCLVEPMAQRLVFSNRLGSLRTWVLELPPEKLSLSPYLCVWLALATLISNLRADVEKYLAGAQKIAREREDRTLLGAIEAIRVLRSGYRGEVEAAGELARQALETLPAEEKYYRGILHRALGIIEVTEDRPVSAESWFVSSTELGLESGNRFSAAVGMAMRAHAVGQQGLTDQALARLDAAADYAALNLGYPVVQIPLVQSRLLHDAWEVERAIELMHNFDDLCIDTGYMIFSATGHFLLTQLYWAKGNTQAVEYHLEMARRQTLAYGSMSGVIPHETWIARMRLAEGNWDSADVWERSERADPTSKLTYATRSTLERIRLWRAINGRDAGCADYHLGQLRELGRQARADGRAGDMVDSWIAQATGEYHLSNVEAALNSIGSALALAESAGFLRPFFEEGPRIQPLLHEAHKRGLFPGFLARLDRAQSQGCSGTFVPPPSALLSEREVEILRLLAMGYQNQEIADRVVLSENTVKTHLKNVYAKLGIKNRTQAVARGRELRLVP